MSKACWASGWDYSEELEFGEEEEFVDETLLMDEVDLRLLDNDIE